MFIIVILKESLVLMYFASHCDTMESWKVFVGHCDTSYAKKKKLKFSNVCRLNFSRTVKYIWSSHFPEFISRIILIRKDSFVYKYLATCIKNYQFLIIFIEINKNVWLLCAHPLKTSIVLHSRRPIY